MESNVHEWTVLTPAIYRQWIIENFSQHWALNDPAHRVEHFRNVEECGILINERLALKFDPILIQAAAFFHDLFAWSRFNHHLMSEHYVRTSDHYLFKFFDPEAREILANACGQHRASFKGEFFHPFCELINAADRELPGNIEAMMQRSLAYNLAQGHSQEEADKIMRTHLKEKFGVNGYARYPKIYQDAFGDELEKQRQDIMNI